MLYRYYGYTDFLALQLRRKIHQRDYQRKLILKSENAVYDCELVHNNSVNLEPLNLYCKEEKLIVLPYRIA